MLSPTKRIKFLAALKLCSLLVFIPVMTLAQEVKSNNNDNNLQNSTKSIVNDSTNTALLVRKVNFRLSRIKSGFLVGGVAIMGGAAVSILAITKDPPSASNYSNLSEYQTKLDIYNRDQKYLLTASAVLYASGGFIMALTGAKIKPITLVKKENRSLSMANGLDGVTLKYKF